MEIDEQEEVVDSIRNDLEQAFADSEPQDDVVATAPERSRDETGRFAKAEKQQPEVIAPAAAETIPDAPRSWTAAEKAEWASMTPNQRAAVQRRESEVELGFTKLDEDRNFGKSLKEVIAPYMPIIQSEGGSPAAAVQSLLNTAYILRTAPVAQKTALFHQLAKQYGVDLSNTPAVQPNDPLMQTQQQIADLQRQLQQQPEVFRQQQENLAAKSMIDAFAADPKNIYYEKLKPVMASLLKSEQAKDLQDAYDKASWADPEIRSSLLATQEKEAESKRIADIKAKADSARKKAVSIKGSPSINPVATNGNANNSIADDIREAWDMHA